MQNFKTTPWSRPRVMMTCHFHDKMAHLPQIIIFVTKTINISSVYLLAPFMVQSFKKKPLIDLEI